MKTYRIYCGDQYKGDFSLPALPQSGDFINLNGEMWVVDFRKFEAGRTYISIYLKK